MTIRITAMLLAGLLLSSTSLAATYHVATTAAGASDSNDGLSVTNIGDGGGPWKTLSHAARLAQAGDTVLIYNGDYRSEDTGWGVGTIYIANSGNSASSAIEFKSAAGQKPVFKSILIHDKNWISIQGLTFINPEFDLPETWRDMPEIVVDSDIAIDFNTDFAERESDVRQRFSTYMGIQDTLLSNYSNAVDIKSSSNISIGYNTIQRYAFGIQVRSNSSGITIEHNDISYCYDGIFTWRPAPSISNSTIRFNRIQQIFNNGMQVREFATNVLIEHNTVHYSGTAHISVLADSTDITVRNNLGRFGGYYTETMTFPGSSAFNIHTSGAGNIVEANIATDQVDLTGIDGNGFIADLMREGGDVVFRNNIALRNRGSGIRTVESPNSEIVNNTFIENGYGAGSNTKNGGGIQLSRDQDTNTRILNNIFYNNNPAGIKSYYLLEEQNVIDHNLYYSGQGNPFIWDGFNPDERAFYSLGSIRDFFSIEQNGVSDDPEFTDPTKLNFQLSSGSSIAVDNGLDIASVRDDLVGKTRPSGSRFDIGAYEFGPSPCPTNDLTRVLRDQTWALISLPCGPLEGFTVAEVFSDDLPGALAESWAIFVFDYKINQYLAATENTRLPPGEAFWVVQASGTSQTIDLPNGSLQTPSTAPNSLCSSVKGCRRVELIESGSQATRFRLVGNPYAKAINYGELNVSADNAACSDIDGCSLWQAISPNGIISNAMWQYEDTATNPGYTQQTPTSTLSPWEGFWLSLAPGLESQTLSLHFPNR